MNFTNEIKQLHAIVGGASEKIIEEYTHFYFVRASTSLAIDIAVVVSIIYAFVFVYKKAKKSPWEDIENVMEEPGFVLLSIILLIAVSLTLFCCVADIPEAISSVAAPKAYAIKSLISSIRR